MNAPDMVTTPHLRLLPVKHLSLQPIQNGFLNNLNM
jgi:hypothetical protein